MGEIGTIQRVQLGLATEAEQLLDRGPRDRHGDQEVGVLVSGGADAESNYVKVGAADLEGLGLLDSELEDLLDNSVVELQENHCSGMRRLLPRLIRPHDPSKTILGFLCFYFSFFVHLYFLEKKRKSNNSKNGEGRKQIDQPALRPRQLIYITAPSSYSAKTNGYWMINKNPLKLLCIGSAV